MQRGMGRFKSSKSKVQSSELSRRDRKKNPSDKVGVSDSGVRGISDRP